MAEGRARLVEYNHCAYYRVDMVVYMYHIILLYIYINARTLLTATQKTTPHLGSVNLAVEPAAYKQLPPAGPRQSQFRVNAEYDRNIAVV